MLTQEVKLLLEPVTEDALTNVSFRPGDRVLRCACGACYYPDSMVTLCQHNSGECVACGGVNYTITTIGGD